jgi:hypothetical protein
MIFMVLSESVADKWLEQMHIELPHHKLLGNIGVPPCFPHIRTFQV